MSIVIPQLKVIVADALTAATVATMSVSGTMGQTLYVDAAADSFNASQSVAVVETALKTSSVDSFAISDSQTVLRKQHNVSAYDSFSCSESQSLLLKHLNLQVADSISASESQSYLRGQLVINPVDSFTASESSSIRQGQLILNPSDAFTSTDSATVSPQAAISGIVISTGDSINASQSQSFRIGQLVLNLADSFSLSDSNSNRVTPLRISSADGISASQSVTVTPSSVSVLTVSTGDSFSASDSRTVLEPRLIVSPYDSLSTSDYASTGGVVSILSISAYDRFVATGIPSFNWNRYNLSTHDSIYSWDVITKDLPGYAELTTETGPFSKLQYQPRGRNNWDDWDSWRNELIGTLRNTLNVGQWPDGGGYKKYPSGIPFPVYSSYYDFTAQEPGGTLTGSTPASVTLSPVPTGVNGTDVGHYLYVSGGTGTAEAVLITGGTAKSGGTSGTIEFTPANNHSGSWTIQSATAGIQEAHYENLRITLPMGNVEVYAPIRLTGKSLILEGQGQTSFGVAARGTRIHNNGTGLLFSVAQTNSIVIDSEFKLINLTVDGGEGVVQLYNFSTNNNFVAEDCAFINMTGTAFEIGKDDTDGDAYLVKINRCFFHEVDKAVVQHKQGEITFRDSYIWRYNTRGLELHGNDAKIINSYFLSNNGATGTENEDILIYPFSSNAGDCGWILIDGCKFGNEEAVAGETRAKIRVGNTALKAANPTYYIMGLMVVNNHFLGTSENGSDKTCCIALHSPLYGSIISGNTFYNSTYAIDDSGMDQTVYASENIYTDNRHAFQVLPFKSGGRGFSIIRDVEVADYYGMNGKIDSSGNVTWQSSNLFTRSENFSDSSWVKYNVTETSGKSDPFGGTAAYELNRIGTSGYVAAQFTTVGAGTYVFSLWMKSDTVNYASIEIATSGGTTLTRTSKYLSNKWQRYFVRCADLAATTAYNVYIKIDPYGSSTGKILAFGAQVSNSETPIFYLQTKNPTTEIIVQDVFSVYTVKI